MIKRLRKEKKEREEKFKGKAKQHVVSSRTGSLVVTGRNTRGLLEKRTVLSASIV